MVIGAEGNDGGNDFFLSVSILKHAVASLKVQAGEKT